MYLKVHKENLTKSGGNIDRKDVFLLVGAGPKACLQWMGDTDFVRWTFARQGVDDAVCPNAHKDERAWDGESSSH